MSASHIPHDGKDKLVSVICRTVGRATLANTLDSLARQNHPTLEVILVDAGGTNLEDKIPPDFRHQIKRVGSGTTLSRPEAANLGLESSSGEYLLCLDDDDWIAAEHISNLVTTLIDNSKVIVAYSSTAKVTEQGELTDLAFNQDYDPVLLMRDNYIPIHAALFRRSVLQQGCRFDPELEIYEDWDFWLQLTQLGNFLHIDVISAFYREGGESETGAATSDNRYSPDTPLGASRAKLYQKWKDRWSGEQLNALVGKILLNRRFRNCMTKYSARIRHSTKSPSDCRAPKTSFSSLKISTPQKFLPDRQQRNSLTVSPQRKRNQSTHSATVSRNSPCR